MDDFTFVLKSSKLVMEVRPTVFKHARAEALVAVTVSLFSSGVSSPLKRTGPKFPPVGGISDGNSVAFRSGLLGRR